MVPRWYPPIGRPIGTPPRDTHITWPWRLRPAVSYQSSGAASAPGGNTPRALYGAGADGHPEAPDRRPLGACPYRRQCAECSPSNFIDSLLQTVMGSQRGQCSYDADCGCGDPPAFSDALEHGDPFVGLYVTIQYLHAGFKESVAQHCQTGAIKRRSLCHVLLESATHNLAKFWDALSGWSPWRKLRPGISAQNGMQFPRQGSIGNCDPV